jgi:hypothetical protein
MGNLFPINFHNLPLESEIEHDKIFSQEQYPVQALGEQGAPPVGGHLPGVAEQPLASTLPHFNTYTLTHFYTYTLTHFYTFTFLYFHPFTLLQSF